MKAFQKNNLKQIHWVCNDQMDSGAEWKNLNGALCAVLFGRSKREAANVSEWRVQA